MGHKKRSIAPRSKPSNPPIAASPPDDPAAADGGASIPLSVKNPAADSETNGNPSPSYAAVKAECERALNVMRRGNHTKSLRLMKDLLSKSGDSPHLALIHRVQGTVCVKMASIIDDPNAKQRHMRNAVESARRAVSLSPNSIEFSHFYANLLYEVAGDGSEYDQVLQECERALMIENPVDPAKESLHDESQQKISTADARIAHVQGEIRSLISKSNIGSLSSWMKNLGNGEEKFRLIPIRRVPEDPMEVSLVPPKRPNEIKKVAKTDEERRKEIEVRVAAARILQQKSESPHLGNDDDSSNNNSKAVDSGPGSGQRSGERRRYGNGRKNATSNARRDYVQSFWNSMSLDCKKDFLRVIVSDLKEHFRSLTGFASEVLNESLSFGEFHKVWKFWLCCRCNEKFADATSFMHHVVQEHMGSLLPKMQSILPRSVENEWAEMLLNYAWKPLDLNAAIKMLVGHPKSEESDSLEKLYPRNSMDDSKECFLDTHCNENEWDLSPRMKKSGHNISGSTQGSREFEGAEWMDCNGDQSRKEHLLHESWPISDDPERAKLLDKIRAIFKTLIENKYLGSSHLGKVMHFAVEELQSRACSSQVLNSKLEQSPLCICFLGAPELKKILNFLQEISHACELNRYSDKNNDAGDSSTRVQGVGILEKIVFSQDNLLLVLDEDFLPSKTPSCVSCDDTANSSSVATSSHLHSDNGVIFDSDALLSWIFKGPSSNEQLASWIRAKEEKAEKGLEILQLLEKESYHLQGLCERKCEHMSYEEALQAVEDVCLEEGKRRELATDFVRHSYDSVLRKRQEELVEDDNGVMVTNNKFELDAITNVLKDAEALNVNQFGFEDTYSGVSSHLCDLESGEGDDWRAKDYLHQVDSCIEVAIQRQKEQVSIEISKMDARIMRILVGMQKLELDLEPASSHDFRSILIPLLKSYLRARLEDVAEKDARKRSDAAREAFLAELAMDSKKGISAGVDSTKHVHEKSKDKRKSRESRKNKDPKANNSDEPQDQISEEILVPSDYVDEGQGTEIVDSGADDALRLQEEEYTRLIELEAEERKLEETLEYQRQIENEAKQKHLSEQNKKNVKAAEEKAEQIATSDAYLRLDVDNKDVNGQWEDMKEPLFQENGITDILEGMQNNSANGDILQSGLTNGVISQDGAVFSNRRTGRRGRRHKGLTTKLSDGNYLPSTSEKEDNDAGQTKYGQNSLGDGDNGGKTLRQLQAEEDDEERFQADLKKAVLQSLDTLHSRGKPSLIPNSTVPQKELPETSDPCVSLDEVVSDGYGSGLKNEVGEYNCFLNVIIQSLWHLRRFRDDFLRRPLSEHVHVGDPCVICALYDIFIALGMVSKDNRREPVAPTTLRIALSNLYPNSNFFQEGQMNDASEVLNVIFNCLHRSYAPSVVTDAKLVDGGCPGWDCTNASCIAHSIFGMDIFERMNCYNCGLESKYLKYTSVFHNINANAIRTMKVMCPESSFDELMNLVEMNHQVACDPEAGGCGKLNYIHHILSTPPHVFTIVLGWQNTSENVADIMATLSALSTDIDISVLYRGLDPQNRHRLVSVVCYYGQHYHCFAYSHDHEQWMMYDDKTVKVIGGWNDVLTNCERGHLQPQVLLFEAVN